MRIKEISLQSLQLKLSFHCTRIWRPLQRPPLGAKRQMDSVPSAS